MGFQHGLSGLNAASRNLDVIGNNVANANTVGAKSTRAEFADIYASATATGAQFSGLGVKVNDVVQQFSQGDIVSSSSPLDLAVNGTGFFRMETEAGAISYSRNGQFQLDRNGYIVNSDGHRVTGFPANIDGLIQPGVPEALEIVASDITPRMTAQVDATLNLDGRAEPPTEPFDPTDPETYQAATSLKVFDEQGRDTTVALYFQKVGENQWDVYGTADGVPFNAPAADGSFVAVDPATGAGPIANLDFTADGQMAGAGLDPFDMIIPTRATTLAEVDPTRSVAFEMDLSASTQYGSIFGVNELRQDGFTTGQLAGFNIDTDGIVQARYTNGQTRARGQIALVNFANPQGLASIGGNAWAETSQSGQPLVGAPGSASLGSIQSGALEQSNVDLTAELVNMIMAQRSYQANSQTVRAQDQILQTITNLR